MPKKDKGHKKKHKRNFSSVTTPVVQTTNSGNRQTANTSNVLNLPTGITAGDLLIALFASKDTVGVSYPLGWTKFGEQINAGGSNATISPAWRKADGTEGASITVTSASSRMAYATYRISGAADPTVRAPEATGANGTNTLNPDPPTLTPTGGAKDYLWLVAIGISHGRIVSSLPANYTDSIGSGPDNGTATNVGMGSGRRALNAASENPGTFTITGTGVEESAVVTIAIHPGGSAFTQSVSGGITPSGDILKQDSKVLSGGFTPAGSIIKQDNKTLSGDLSSIVGSLLKSTNKSFSGSLSSSGTLLVSRLFSIITSGAIGIAGTIDKLTNKTVSGVLTFSGTNIKQSSKSFSGTLSSSGNLIKTINKLFIGVIGFSSSLSKQTNKSFDGILNSSGNLIKSINKLLSGLLISAGDLATQFSGGVQTFFKDLTGTLTSSGILNKSSIKLLSGNLTISGSISKLTNKFFTGIITSSGTLSIGSLYNKILNGTLFLSGSISKLTSKSLSGQLLISGGISKSISKFIGGILNFIGSLSASGGSISVNISTTRLRGTRELLIHLIGTKELIINLKGQVEEQLITQLEGSADNVVNLNGNIQSHIILKGTK